MEQVRRIVVRGFEYSNVAGRRLKAKGMTIKTGDISCLGSLLSGLRILFNDDCIIGVMCDKRQVEVADLDWIQDEDDLSIITSRDHDVTPTQLSVNASAESVSAAVEDTDWVTLNVGGTHFSTCKSTLLIKAPQDSVLARMFSNESRGLMAACRRDRNGCYLIDRSPKYFEPILNYLRTGQLILESDVSPEGVYEEAKFFGLGRDVTTQLESMIGAEANQEKKPLTRREVVASLVTTTHVSELRFQGTNLAGADLSKLDLRKINFRFANLQGCNLKGANMSFCNMERADLSGANADGATFSGARMVCAILENVSMRGCTFDDPSGQPACLEGANLRKADLEDSSMANVNLRVATLKHVNLKNCYLKSAVLAGADLEHCDLSGSDLCEANLRGANLENAKLELMPTPLHMSALTVR